MDKKYLEAIQIEVKNASNKPRNINLSIFDAEKYFKQLFQLIWTQKYNFWSNSSPEISSFLFMY